MADATTPPGTAAIAEAIRAARSAGTPLRLVGGGRWMDAGRPVVTGAAPLALADCRGVLEYVPGDLVLTCGAATTLAELDDATRPHGQQVALDPFGDDLGTIGATVATASVGPLAHGYGAPRDQLLGLTYVAGDGTIAQGGGRVVKNVAGFDVVRLHCGAWGTLGAITAVSLRCFARPAVDRTVALPVPAGVTAQDELVDTLRAAPLAPIASAWVDAGLAHALGLPHATHALLRLGGNAAHVAGQRGELARLGGAIDVDPAAWTRLRAMDGPAIAVARVSWRPAALAGTWRHVEAQLDTFLPAGTPRRIAALPSRGVVRVAIDTADDAALTAVVAHLAPPGGAVRWERLPAAVWPFVRTAVDDPLSGRVRAAFDPGALLNRGILGEREAALPPLAPPAALAR